MSQRIPALNTFRDRTLPVKDHNSVHLMADAIMRLQSKVKKSRGRK